MVADPSGVRQVAGHAAPSTGDRGHRRRRRLAASRARGRGYVLPASGEPFDGHDFASRAVADGAVALLVDHLVDVPAEVAQIVVDDTRVRRRPARRGRWPGIPVDSLTTVGITGTNGKTTTAQFLAAIFDAEWPHDRGHRHAVAVRARPRRQPELQRTVASASSTTAVPSRSWRCRRTRSRSTGSTAPGSTSPCSPTWAAITSISTARRSATSAAKARLFTPDFSSLGVINVDDPHGRLLADTAESSDPRFRVVAVSTHDLADVHVDAASHRYRWRGLDVEVPIGGRFNVANSLIALTTAVELGVEPAVAAARAAIGGGRPGPVRAGPDTGRRTSGPDRRRRLRAHARRPRRGVGLRRERWRPATR